MNPKPSMTQALVAEAVGTFLLVLIGGGAGVAATLGGTSFGEALLVAALAHGLALAIIVNVFGGLSGAHVNPAVSIGLASANRFAWSRVPGYIVAQFIGAIVAVLAIVGMFGEQAFKLAAASAPALAPHINGVQGTLAEALGAFVLVLAVTAAATDKRLNLPAGWAGLIIGLALACGIFVAGGVSGAGLNPALAIAPYIIDLIHSPKVVLAGEMPLYVIGPIIGGVAGALLYKYASSLPTSK